MKPTRFDIYARNGGRWSRRESFGGESNDEALAAAAALDGSGTVEGVRVMAVTEYEGGRAPLETLNWISPHLSKVASVQRQMKSAADKATRAQAPSEPPSPPPPPTPSVAARPAPPPPPAAAPEELPRVFSKPRVPKASRRAQRKARSDGAPLAGRVVANVLVAIVIGVVAFVPLTMMIHSVGPTTDMPATQQGALALLASLGVFLLAAVLLTGRTYRRYKGASLEDSEPLETFEIVLPPPPPPAAMIPRTTGLEIPHPALDGPPPEPEVPPHPAMEAVAMEAAPDPTPAAPPPPQKKPGEAFGENARRAVLEFLAHALAAVKDEVPRMNQHVAFGLNLFGAGAAEFYGRQSGLSRMQAFVLVRETVSALGNSPDRVDAFCRQYMEYASDDRYRMMMECGRRVMERQVAGSADAFAEFRDALKDWTSDAAVRAKSQGIVCIMFTDIVGSTAMTHEHGDYAAQEVVRVHNAIVRSALAAHHGKEVKHTGDGIMASFTMAANAVRATMEIRDTLAKHNGNQGSVPVKVRIGLNAGEAVQEEDDFFGTTVQLAARVCDKAGTGEIFVTDNVRELAKGKGLTFAEAGQFAMKGVPAPMTLYRVG